MASTSPTPKKCFAACWSWTATRERTRREALIGIGSIRGRIAYLVFAELGPDTVRMISLRKATSREHKQYEKAIQNRLEAG
jgi:uncharacterized DUF497 family protein